MAKKGNRVQVILECIEQKESGMPGMSRYITTKNKKNTPDRMERRDTYTDFSTDPETSNRSPRNQIRLNHGKESSRNTQNRHW